MGSFNEAEAFTPRIHMIRAWPLGDKPGASMRPRLLHLGYMRICGLSSPKMPISFNEAEAFTPRIRRRGKPGHIPRGRASMRPRLLHLGYRADGQIPRPASGASMRPRLLHLGYVDRVSRVCLAGLRFNEAEAFTPRILTWKSARTMTSTRCFNEAEAFTPRIPGQMACLPAAPGRLQ